jgi:uncharacterized protein DUF3301
MLETFGLLALAAGLWLWYDSVRAREAGVRASRAACGVEGLLFLDDTVAISSIWPARDEYGNLKLRRVYRFEYSDTGNNRREGAITLLGEQILSLHLGPASPLPPMSRT